MQMRRTPKSRRNARGRPQRLQRFSLRVENFGLRFALAMWALVAIFPPPLLPERHAEELEQAAGFLVGLGARDDGDVHAAGRVDLVVADLGEHHLLLDAEAVVAAAVEAVGGHAAEVAHARQGDVDEAVEERPHLHAVQRGAQPHWHAGTDPEVRHRLRGAGDGRTLQRDLGDLARGLLEHLGVVARLAEAHVHDDLLDARHRHRVGVAVALGQLRQDGRVALLDGEFYFLYAPHSSNTLPVLTATCTLRPSSWNR